MSLAVVAYHQGRAAAETYRREGRQEPPRLLGPAAPPVSLTKVLKDDYGQPTEAEVQTVAEEWTRGVGDMWGAGVSG